MNHSRLIIMLGFIFFGILSRFLPHPPNFTAINSIALFYAYFMGRLNVSLLAVFAMMLVSDFLIGFHSSIAFVYLSCGLITWLGHLVFNSKKSLSLIPFFLLGSSLLFFVITNFGVWATSSLYSKTFQGLGLCYLAALPFLSNQILGDLIYGFAMFGCFSFIEYIFPSIRLDFKKS